MKIPRIFKPHNPLADRLNDQRGVTAATATTQAEVAIQRLEPEVMTEVDRVLTVLTADLVRYRAAGEETSAFEIGRVYAAAGTVASLAPRFDRPRLGQAATSLCKLIAEEKGVRPEAIAVHIEAMVLIRRDEAAGDVVLPGLLQLSEDAAGELDGATNLANRRQALSASTGTVEVSGEANALVRDPARIDSLH